MLYSTSASVNKPVLRSKFLYHIKRALLRRQAPSFQRVVRMIQIEAQEGRRTVDGSFTEASGKGWDPFVSKAEVFADPVYSHGQQQHTLDGFGVGDVSALHDCSHSWCKLPCRG